MQHGDLKFFIMMHIGVQEGILLGAGKNLP